MPEKCTFNGLTKRIIVNSGESAISVKADIYSGWKRWILISSNSSYLQALRVIGGDPVGGGQFAGDIYFLMNGWQVEIGHMVNISGILYHDDGISPYVVLPAGGVIATVSSLAQTLTTTVPVVTGDLADVPAAVWAQLVTNPTVGSYGQTVTEIKTKAAAIEIATDTVESGVAGIQTDVTAVLSNLGAVTDLVNTMLKYSRNRTKIDSTAFTMTVFDNDGITPIKVFDLKNIAGQSSITQVAERRPQ